MEQPLCGSGPPTNFMSEQEQPNETKVNDEFTERVNNAYIGSGYGIFNGVEEDLVLIFGKNKKDESVDILINFQGLKEMAEDVLSKSQQK